MLACLAREGDIRWLFAVLTPEDFYRYRGAYEALAALYATGELRCEWGPGGHHWPGLDEVTARLCNRLCAGARTLGSREAAADHLQRLTARRVTMHAALELFNALGADDEDGAERALEHLRGSAA